MGLHVEECRPRKGTLIDLEIRQHIFTPHKPNKKVSLYHTTIVETKKHDRIFHTAKHHKILWQKDTHASHDKHTHTNTHSHKHG